MLLQLVRARLGAEATATLCELRASSKHELMTMKNVIGVQPVHERRTGKIAQDRLGDPIAVLHHWNMPSYESEFPMLLTVSHVFRGVVQAERTQRYGLLSTVLSLPPGTRPLCHIVALNVSASSPASRSVLLLDASRVLDMTPIGNTAGKPPLLIMHGPERFPNETYVGMAWKRRMEPCWQSSWARLLGQKSIFDPTCTSDRRTENATRACAAWLNTSTGCTRRQPLLPEEVTNRGPAGRHRGKRTGRSRLGETDKDGDLVDQSSSASSVTPSCHTPTVRYERIFFSSRHMRQHVIASLRYYTLVPCDAEPGDGGGVGPVRPPRAMCLLFKQGVNEVWVGGLRSLDGGYSFSGEVELAMPAVNLLALRRGENWGLPTHATMTHNYA